jgi:HEAT repeat protein
LPEVRIEAVSGLGQIGTPQAGAALLDQLGREKEDGVRQALLFWLGGMKYAPAADAVGSALKDPNPNIRAQAAHSLGWIGSTRAKTLLKDAAKDSDANVQAVIDANKR